MVVVDSGGMFRVLCLFAVLRCGCLLDTGMLFPRETSSREVKELNGLWKFRADMSPNRNQGFERAWYKTHLEEVKANISVCPLYPSAVVGVNVIWNSRFVEK